LAWHLQPTAGMLVPSRLARGHFFPQRPLWDLISASLTKASIKGCLGTAD